MLQNQVLDVFHTLNRVIAATPDICAMYLSAFLRKAGDRHSGTHLSIILCLKSLIFGASGSLKSQSPCHMQSAKQILCNDQAKMVINPDRLHFMVCKSVGFGAVLNADPETVNGQDKVFLMSWLTNFYSRCK